MMEVSTEEQKGMSRQEIIVLSDAKENDAVTIFDLIKVIREKFVLVSIIVALVTGIAVVVALNLPQVYSAKVVIYPPSPADVQSINIPNIYEVSAEELLDEMYNNLQSNELRHQFFVENNLYDYFKKLKIKYKNIEDVYNNEFRDAISVKKIASKKKEVEPIIVSLEGRTPVEVANWLNSYVEKVDKYTVSVVNNTVAAIFKVQMRDVEKRIESIRELAKKQRFDEIVRLEEALLIAENIGLEELAPNTSIMFKQLLVATSDALSVSGLDSNQNYLQGAKALRAQLAVLKKRTSDDSFVPELRGLQEKLFYLEGYSLSNIDFHAARIVERAHAQMKPYKPKVKLIVVLGFVLGVMISVLVAVAKSAYENSMRKG